MVPHNLIMQQAGISMTFEWDEDRYIAIGCVADILFVVFTERKDNIRIISARMATEAERRLYYDENIHY